MNYFLKVVLCVINYLIFRLKKNNRIFFSIIYNYLLAKLTGNKIIAISKKLIITYQI